MSNGAKRAAPRDARCRSASSSSHALERRSTNARCVTGRSWPVSGAGPVEATPEMDRTILVTTPESIAFRYELAGLGSRFLAVAFDGLVQGLAMWGLVWLFIATAGRAHLSRLAENVAAGLFVFAIFTVLFGYFIFFEAFWHGQTPGKRLMRVRVVRDGGYPLDFVASLVRNLIRIAELAFGGYAISAISALVSSENKRIGDFAAGTIVVRESKIDAPRAGTARYAATSILRGDERELVHGFLERRDALPPQRRAAIAASLAERVRPRVSPELARLDDESLLERL